MSPTFRRVLEELRPWVNGASQSRYQRPGEALDEDDLLDRLDDDIAAVTDIALPSLLFAIEYLALVAEMFRNSFKGNVPPFAVPGHLRTALLAAARAILVLEPDDSHARRFQCATVLGEEWKRQRQVLEDAPDEVEPDRARYIALLSAREEAVRVKYQTPKRPPTDLAVVERAGKYVDLYESVAKETEGFFAVQTWHQAGLFAYRTGSGWAHGLQWPLGYPRQGSVVSLPMEVPLTFMPRVWENNYHVARVFVEVAVARLVEVTGMESPEERIRPD